MRLSSARSGASWHGKPRQAVDRFHEVEWRMWHFAARYPKFTALARAVYEFQRYIDRNAHMIPDYGARWAGGPGHFDGLHRVAGEVTAGQALRKEAVHTVAARRRSPAPPGAHPEH